MSEKLGAQRQILHVSGDFPDSVAPSKTPVIQTLLKLTQGQFDHSVISINRRSPAMARFAWDTLRTLGKPPLEVDSAPFDQGTALVYKSPPKGIFHAAMLHRLGEYIATHIASLPRQPDLIVGHKLSIEGIAVRRAAALCGIPYAISIQGNTDAKIVAARPDLRSELGAVLHDARMVFPFSPWALQQIEARLGARSGPVTMLPCPTDIDAPIAPRAKGDGFISVFHLRNYATKNLVGMAKAAQLLNAKGQTVPLSVIGGGSADDIARCSKIAQGAKGLTFAGPMDRETLRTRMSQATGFVMPSRRESFGLVFIEALFCGIPIIYPAGAAVDGYFDGAPFAIRVDATDPAAIANAMLHIQKNEAGIKLALEQWQHSADAQRFTRVAIAQAFASGLHAASGA
ncbi:MAG: hypothetical protein B7Y89_14515 [Novosphingobium sp. 32-60-15]|uniref:glycosyltransferase n=1 Tax=unclassified Novosphingobium TaxID=2644732 RepID=UPI000BCE7D0A|nr:MULTISPECIES: glycosyltransferase [unclassified Novosphingobium]OYX61068.1 MAG: hypothetical protein B7Y89_14515 [Novosphingobium sp. 32-60-15]